MTNLMRRRKPTLRRPFLTFQQKTASWVTNYQIQMGMLISIVISTDQPIWSFPSNLRVQSTPYRWRMTHILSTQAWLVWLAQIRTLHSVKQSFNKIAITTSIQVQSTKATRSVKNWANTKSQPRMPNKALSVSKSKTTSRLPTNWWAPSNYSSRARRVLT